jgi:serine/threonine-protein kinase
MALATCGDMVDNLRRLQLLDSPQQKELVETLPRRFEDPRDLARELMRRDWLTLFQVNHLLQNCGEELQFGPYLLLDRLGEGGMSRVFKARHRTLGHCVALKVLRKEALTNPLAVPRFEREILVASRLQHPNVVRVFDAGQAADTYYLAMEFIEGADLYQVVKRSGPLPVAQACDVLRQAALGLQHAHEHGLVHRDIKPANLFVTRGLPNDGAASNAALPQPGRDGLPRTPVTEEKYPWGVVKILDFGLARLQAPSADQAILTQFGSVMGTPDFLAPEQATCSPNIDIRADLYSLGCTFYFLLSGRVPFPGGTLPEKLLRHRTAEPEAVDHARREQFLGSSHLRQHLAGAGDAVELPEEVVAVTRKLMAKQPGQRFQTPVELADTARELLRQLLKRTPCDPVRRPSRETCATLRRPTGFNKRPPLTQTSTKHAAKPSPAEDMTQSLHGRTLRRKRRRILLVVAGFLLCCTLTARLWWQGLARDADQTEVKTQEVDKQPVGDRSRRAF